MLALALALVAAAPAPAPGWSAASKSARVLVLETRADAAYLDKVKAFGDLLATVLEQRTSADIVPSSSVKDRLAVAADKLSAGCDETACMTEIAGALDARWVVSSHAAQVGGRWLMRVELFDSQTLKVVAQVSAMSDSVEGLANQAESLADALLAKAPMLPRRGAGAAATTTTTTTSHALPPPDEPHGPGAWPWVLAAGGAGLGVAALAGWTGSFFWAAGEEGKLDKALTAYNADPASAANRKALAAAGRSADDASTLNNCVVAPIGCLSLPLFGVAATGLYWGVTAAPDETGP